MVFTQTGKHILIIGRVCISLSWWKVWSRLVTKAESQSITHLAPPAPIQDAITSTQRYMYTLTGHEIFLSPFFSSLCSSYLTTP